MNGSCAGGTGAFIDQMAALLNTDIGGLNELAKKHTTIYPIASRCGVFAKSDIQPLLNDGAKRSDVAASVFQSVVNQTISGLACGKPIRGNVAFLGGPLHYLSELRARFIETLNLKDDQIIFPENANLFVAMGCAFSDETAEADLDELVKKAGSLGTADMREVERLAPLFRDAAELEAFKARHAKAVIPTADIAKHKGACYLGVDAGSTTTKAVLLNKNAEIIYSYYSGNGGDPLVYPYHDKLFAMFVESWQKTSPADILRWYAEGTLAEHLNCPPEIITSTFKTPGEFIADLERWWKLFCGLAVAKRIQAPPVISITRRAFGYDHREAQLPAYFSREYYKLKNELLKK